MRAPGQFGRDLHTSRILRSISERPRQLSDRVRTLATVLGALRKLIPSKTISALLDRKSERREWLSHRRWALVLPSCGPSSP